MSISNVSSLLYSVNVSMASDSVITGSPFGTTIGTSDTTKVSFVASTLINKESFINSL